MVETDQQVQWLSECDGQIWHDILAVHEDNPLPDGFVPYTTLDMDKELVVPFPYDVVYVYFLIAKTDLVNQEISKYNNDIKLYNDALLTFSDYWTRNHKPIGGRRWHV